jgi:peptide/nickel transport system permease protein
MRGLEWHQLIHNRSALAGLILVTAVLATAVLADAIAPYPPTKIQLAQRFLPPSASHWMGTDEFGRDVFSRVLVGARASLAIALAAVGAGMAVGGSLALFSGYLGGLLDVVVTRVVDVFLAIPVLLIAIGVVALLGPSGASVAMALAIAYAPTFARVVRSAVVATRAQPYVEASVGIGASTTNVLVADIVPNLLPIVMVQATVAVAWVFLDEASLGFLGLGVQPPNASWGSLLLEGRQFVFQAPWIALGAGFAVLIAVFGFNLLGDGLRDVLDPRTVERGG